ncbi:RNA polymerase sigma factor [uncultured Marinobacter sp.]|uniref:RNA polymerase sigma factor n=1 Tax=uncultured Marinobacter sp. TaxID=187379 RepID=UPI00262E870A|nr:RNA polymerase sigma factor [uncultured Marinobacter sp.]
MGTAAHTETELSLVERMKEGDPSAYKHAVRHYSPSMLAVARFYLDHANADEVVQDCWVSVIDAIQKFEGRSGLKTWLHRIVANRCKNQIRSSSREVVTDFSDSLDPDLANRFKPSGRWKAPPQARFHESAEALMETEALNDCLDKHLSALPETQRSALMLYEAHQHASGEVCNILDVSASNLRVLLHRARQKVFLMVEAFQETGEC